MLDCRGLACPQPVMRTRDLLAAESPERVEVLVDNEAAGRNVSRFLTSQGYRAEVERRGSDHLVRGVRDTRMPVSSGEPVETYSCAPGGRRILVFVTADHIGRGDEALGRGLMKNFLLTLKEMGGELWRLIFVNSGVKLCVRGSESLEALRDLEAGGVSILVCGTCLNHFGLLESKEVGETTNMLDVVTSLQTADQVVTV